jgi:hypothetical protein
MPRIPGHNGALDARGKYGLQRKLQAALARVVEVLGKMDAAGLALNTNSLFLASGVADLLGDFIGDLERAEPAEKQCPAAGLIADVLKRRQRETKARRKRKQLQRKGG